MWTSSAFVVTLDFSDLGTTLTESSSNRTNLSVETGGEDHPASSTFRDSGGAVRDVQSVSRAGVVVQYEIRVLADWEGFAGEQCFVSLEVDCFDESGD
jgi:hypothetical protein